MDKARLQDTIIAVSTPPGFGGLGVLRLSGPDSLAIAEKIFIPARAKTPSKVSPYPPRTAVFGHVANRETGRILDEAFLIHFPAPRSYTREDVVEISCHGSPAVLEEVLRLGVVAGAKPAMPGEFTLRAYLRGRIDILQAEAVQSLIQASNLDQARVSIDQVRGSLSRHIRSLRERLIELMGRIEFQIEFSEGETPRTRHEIRAAIVECTDGAGKLAASFETGRIFSEGVRVVIAGRPNVGKSTLFNALLGHDRAIVAPFPGTTRDYLSEQLRLNGVNFLLTDMAGLGSPRSDVEEEGVRRGRALADEADGVLLILDASRADTGEDRQFVSEFKNKRLILLFNKSDLPRKIDREAVLALLPGAPHLEISALQGTHLEDLRGLMSAVFAPGEKQSEHIVMHLRQKLLLDDAVQVLQSALKLIDGGYTEEYYAEELRSALNRIGQLTGEIASDDVLEAVFSNFCVGK